MDEEADIKAYLNRRLKTRFLGRELHYMESVGSTQDIARELAEKGSPEGTAVIAGNQKAGRGRMGRTWFSPEGNLAMSVILKPEIDELHLLPAVSSLAVMRTIAKFGVRAQIKWPNDVLIDGKKVCGILIESQLESGSLRYAIVGIGINVRFDTRKYPEIANIATSISMHLEKSVGVKEVALTLLEELENYYEKIGKLGILHKEWLDNMETIGRQVKVNMAGSIEEGIAETVDDDGKLLVRRPDGMLLRVVAGDVTLVKD